MQRQRVLNLRVRLALLLDRFAKESAMPEPDEPTAYTAAPPTHTHSQDDVEED